MKERKAPLVEHSYGSCYLNPQLIDRQDCWENVDDLVTKHKEKLDIYENILKEDDKEKLKEYAKKITEIEFELQRLWKFKQDRNYHRFWETPKCTCPKLDNEENYPIGYYTVSEDCPLHS